MRAHLLSFWNDDDGAVTVDWVVLTAALVFLAIVVLVTVRDGIISESELIVVGLEDAVTTSLSE